MQTFKDNVEKYPMYSYTSHVDGGIRENFSRSTIFLSFFSSSNDVERVFWKFCIGNSTFRDVIEYSQ